MAYRELEFGDHVRVVDGGLYHGKDAVVISVGTLNSRVQLRNKIHGETVCVNVLNKKLLIRDGGYDFIRDGKVDNKAKAAHAEKKGVAFAGRPQYPELDDDEEELEEACGECSCCNWHNANY